LKIVHINNTDLTGARFNGHDIQVEFNKRGISCKQFVVEKTGDDPNTISLLRDFEEPYLRNMCRLTEAEMSLHGVVYPYGWRLLQHQDFQEADIAHYHLLHNHFISYAMFSELTATKPSILTIHDPWLFTGHCIYPIKCDKWEKEECKHCPHLIRNIPMKEDNAQYLWSLKKVIFASVNIDLVVASKWMLDLVTRSPITAHFRNVHLIPFGIDTTMFDCKTRNKQAIRARLGIPQDHIVLFFRSDPSEFKGVSYIQEMLKLLRADNPITLLTVGQMGLVKPGSHNIVENGWINDENLMADFYAASDIFLMPSIAEAFGVMAIEAMASSLPIFVFEGTALPDVTFAPNCGIVLDNNDPKEFANAVERLIKDQNERIHRGTLGREIAVKHYDRKQHFDRLLELYNEIIQRG